MSIHNDLVEGIFFNSMLSLLQQQSVKSSWIQQGRLPEQITLSVMKIGPAHIRDLAMIISLVEQDTTQSDGLGSDKKPESPARQSEIFISENIWSYIKILGLTSGRLVNEMPFLDKDRCTFPDWLLINSILETPESIQQFTSLNHELSQSVADCYRHTIDL